VPTVEGKTLPAGRGGVSLSHAPYGEKGHKARDTIQGIGAGEGAPHAPERGRWQSARSIVPRAGAKRHGPGRGGTRVPGPHCRAGDAGHHGCLEGPLGATPGSPPVSRTRQRIAPQAPCSPARVGNNVVPLMDREVWRDASRHTWKSRAPGLDQVTATPYAEHLAENRRDRHARVRDNRYVAPPGERGWLEQDAGQQRPRGNPCGADTLVQRAVVMLLEALCAHDLQAFSPGFSKGHSPHPALHDLREQCRKLPIHWRVEAEVSGFFAPLDGRHWRAFLPPRGSDGGIVRLIGKGRHAGVLAAGALSSPATGTPHGGVGSPMGANIFLHQVVDAWGVQDVPPGCRAGAV
jgi:hypothetical protein